MIAEGKGQCDPRPITVTMDRATCHILANHAKRQAKFRGYSQTGDQWRNGLCPELVDPVVGAISQSVRPIYCGLLGEEAVCDLMRRRLGIRVNPDLTLKPRGDLGVDLTIAGLTAQVKTRQKDAAPNRIRLTFENGVPVIRQADIHVFCRWCGGRTVDVLGWVWTVDLQRLEVVPGKGDWWNVEPDDADLLPLARLIDELKAKQLWQLWRA